MFIFDANIKNANQAYVTEYKTNQQKANTLYPALTFKMPSVKNILTSARNKRKNRVQMQVLGIQHDTHYKALVCNARHL